MAINANGITNLNVKCNGNKVDCVNANGTVVYIAATERSSMGGSFASYNFDYSDYSANFTMNTDNAPLFAFEIPSGMTVNKIQVSSSGGMHQVSMYRNGQSPAFNGTPIINNTNYTWTGSQAGPFTLWVEYNTIGYGSRTSKEKIWINDIPCNLDV